MLSTTLPAGTIMQQSTTEGMVGLPTQCVSISTCLPSVLVVLSVAPAHVVAGHTEAPLGHPITVDELVCPSSLLPCWDPSTHCPRGCHAVWHARVYCRIPWISCMYISWHVHRMTASIASPRWTLTGDPLTCRVMDQSRLVSSGVLCWYRMCGAHPVCMIMPRR